MVTTPARTYVFVLLCCLLGAVGCAADDVVQQPPTGDLPSDVSAPGEAEAPVTLDGLITSEVDTIEVTRSDMGRSRELEARYNALVIEDSSLLPLTPTLFLDGEPFGYTLAISISWAPFPKDEPPPLCELANLRDDCRVHFLVELPDLGPGEHWVEFAATDTAGTVYTSSPLAFELADRTTFEKLKRDFEQGILSADQYALLGYISIIDLSQVPVRYRSETPNTESTGEEEPTQALYWEYDLPTSPEVGVAIEQAMDLYSRVQDEAAVALLLETYLSTGGSLD